MSDRLAEIKERADFFGSHSGLVTISSRDALALVEIAKAAREHYDEWAAVNPPDLFLPLPIQKIGRALSALNGEEGEA